MPTKAVIDNLTDILQTAVNAREEKNSSKELRAYYLFLGYTYSVIDYLKDTGREVEKLEEIADKLRDDLDKSELDEAEESARKIISSIIGYMQSRDGSSTENPDQPG